MRYFITTTFLIFFLANFTIGQDTTRLSIKDFGAPDDWVDTFPRILFEHKEDCIDEEFKLCFYSNFDSRLEAYSYEQQMEDYKLLQSDTLKLTTRITKLIKITAFDCSNHMGIEARHQLDSLKQDIFSKFLGEWNWEWTGSNWGTDATPAMINEKRTINFTPDEIRFTYPDTVIVYPIHVFCLKINHCEEPTLHIRFESKEKKRHRLDNHWMISIMDNIDCNWLIRGVENEDEKQFLYFREVGVVCGATEICYSRATDKD